MKNRIKTPRISVRVYQRTCALALLLTGVGAGCDGESEVRDVEFPGPFLLVDRVDISESDRSLSLVRNESRWTLADTPFLVDTHAADALETSFRRYWEPLELRRVEHTSEALGLNPEHATGVTIWPTDAPAVRITLGRTEGGSSARWTLPERGSAAGLVREAHLLVADPLRWRSERVCPVEAGDVIGLQIDGESRARRVDGEWRGDGIHSYRAEQLVRRLARLDGTPIVPSAAESEETLIRFEIAGDEGSCAIGVHESSDGDFLASIEDVIGFQLEVSDANALLTAPRTLGNPDRLSLVPESLDGARVRGLSPLILNQEERWVTSTEPGSRDCDRYVRTLCRLAAHYDAPETGVAFTLPRRTVYLDAGESTHRVELTWGPDLGAVYARVGSGTPFRVEPASDRMLRGDPCVDPG